MNSDKRIELRRYDERARSLLTAASVERGAREAGAHAIAPIYRAPYLCYEECIVRHVRAEHAVLELAAGTGLHTGSLARRGACVVATDISFHSLRVLSHQIGEQVLTAVADMESLPFADGSFDIVATAGSLSYGNPVKVDAEVARVLKRGGVFLCVDSLNHNPIYRFNRWIAWLRGLRTKSTLERIPTEERLDRISRSFEQASISYFGALSFVMPAIAKLIGQNRAARLSDRLDCLIGTRRSAFKFVLVAQGRL